MVIDSSFRSFEKKNLNKVFAIFDIRIVNLLFIGYGVTAGWSSPNIRLLTSDESPLASGSITMEEASWVASLLCVGGVIGNLFFGFVTNAYGRKMPLILIVIPTIVSQRNMGKSDEVVI